MFSAFKDTLKGGLAFGVSSSLVSAVGFVLIPLYTRYLSMEEFGLLGLISLTVSVSVAVFGLGLSSAIFRSYFDYGDKASQKKLVGTALLVAGAGSVGLIVLATICAEPLIAQRIFNLPDTGKYFRVALYSGAIGLLNTIPLAVYRADRRFGRFAAFNFTSAALQMILIVALVVLLHLGIAGIVIGQLLATLAISVLLLYSVRTKVEIILLKSEVRKLLAYGLPLVPGNVIYLLLTTGSLYFVQATSGLAEVGVFNLAVKISSLFAIFLISPFQLVWLPMMFSVERSSYADRFYSNMLVYVLYISIGISMVLSVFAREVVQIVSTPAYASAAQLVGLLLFGHILFVVQNVFNVGIILKRKTAYWSASLALETTASILMWLALAPRWGTKGIAIGSIIGYAIGAGVTWAFSQRFLKIRYDWRRALFLAVLFPISVGISYMIPASLGSLSIILKGLLVLFMLGCPFLVKFWHPDEIAAAKQFLQQVSRRLPWWLSPAGQS